MYLYINVGSATTSDAKSKNVAKSKMMCFREKAHRIPMCDTIHEMALKRVLDDLKPK